MLNNQGPLFLELNTKIKLGGSADLTSEKSLKLGDSKFEKHENF